MWKVWIRSVTYSIVKIRKYIGRTFVSDQMSVGGDLSTKVIQSNIPKWPNSCHFGKPASIFFTIFLNEIACLRKGHKHERKMPNFLSIDRCQLLRTKRHHQLRQQRPECKAECLGCRPEILYAGLLPSAGSVPGDCQHHDGGSSFSTSRLR